MQKQTVICDDLLEGLTETIKIKPDVNFPKLPVNEKGISGTFGIFNVNEIPDFRRKYQQLPQKPEYEPYRYVCHTEMKFGQICLLKLSLCELTPRIKAETQINHTPYFRKTYKDYSEFLEEWENARE